MKTQNGFSVVEGLIVLIVISALGVVGWSVASRNNTTKQKSGTSKTNTKSTVPTITLDKTGAFKLESTTAGNCTALLPAGWPRPSTNDTATTFDAFSPDKSMYAGYGHQAINTQLAGFAGAYDAPLDDPDLYSAEPSVVALAYTQIIAGSLGGDRAVQYTADTNQTLGDYSLRSFKSSTHQGVVFFKTNGFPGDGANYSYSLPMYFTMASNAAWKANGLSLAKVSASINCTAKLMPRAAPPDVGGDSSSSTDKDKNKDSLGYNVQLGTEYVHDPDTNENYLVDPSRDWSDSGPNGEGYYKSKSGGNDYVQLQPGRSD